MTTFFVSRNNNNVLEAVNDVVLVTNQWQKLPNSESFPYEIEFIEVADTLLIRFKKDGKILEGAGIIIETVEE